MGSLTSGWNTPPVVPIKSVEEELKEEEKLLRKSSGPALERRSIDGQPIRAYNPEADEKHHVILKLAKKQEEQQSDLARRLSASMEDIDVVGPPNLARRSAPGQIRVQIPGHKGSNILLQTRSGDVPSVASRDAEEEEEKLLMEHPMQAKDKWWRKLSSSALNEMAKEVEDVHHTKSSYVPQFGLTGESPYVKL